MAADLTTIGKRVTEALNVCTRATFSATVDSANLDRVSTAIDEYIREGALDIAAAICANPRHPHRNLYISGTPTSLTHGGELPDLAGEGDIVEIQRYSGGSFTPGTPRAAQQIDAYRLNPSSLLSSLSHTTQNSPLAGYYNISNGRVRFTGFAAQMYIPVISRSTVTGLIPDEAEGLWFGRSMHYALKEGDNMAPISMYYGQWSDRALAALSANSIIPPAPPIERALRARGDS
jgi:hypothetical protein